MTKSKGIGRGGHRKGAGRPRFAKTGKTSHFSTRLTPKTRSLLEAEARRRNKSLSEVAEDLLQLGLEEIADLEKPRALRGLLFMIEMLDRHLGPPYRKHPNYSWRTNPYIFEAFRSGVLQLLDTLRPAGEVITPPEVVLEGKYEEDLETPYRYTFPASPNDLARDCVRHLFLVAHFHNRVEKQSLWVATGDSFQRIHYGLVDAHRDLNLTIQRRGQK